MAYLGRYAHQPVGVSLKLTLREAAEMSKNIDAILRRESEMPKG